MTQAGTELQLSQTTLDMFAQMAGALEEYDGGGNDTIIQAILNASTIDEYNNIFEGDRGFPLNTAMKVTRARYMQSDFKGGLPFYLVVEAVNTKTGEAGEFTIGAQSPVATITGATFKGQLPMIVECYESQKETKGGYHPINVRVLAMSEPALDAPAAKSKAGK